MAVVSSTDLLAAVAKNGEEHRELDPPASAEPLTACPSYRRAVVQGQVLQLALSCTDERLAVLTASACHFVYLRRLVDEGSDGSTAANCQRVQQLSRVSPPRVRPARCASLGSFCLLFTVSRFSPVFVDPAHLSFSSSV